MRIRYRPEALGHDTGLHPENRRRLEVFGSLEPEPFCPDGTDYLPLVHAPNYIQAVRKHSEASLPMDDDTQLSPGSFKAAVTGVGLALLAMQDGDFALIRPPGHHAYSMQAAGFCLFNNVAIAAQYAVTQGKRVLIIDIDGHLGDGTMDIFYQNDQVMFWSLHQWPAYPGNGSATEIGEGKGKGYTMNVPLPAGSGDDIFMHALDYMLPAAVQFAPDVVAISAGFDAHQFDPLLQLRATGNFFYKAAKLLRETFPGKLFAVLEGGYNTEELPKCVYNFIAGINDEPMPFPEVGTSSGLRLWETYEIQLHLATGLLSRYWKF